MDTVIIWLNLQDSYGIRIGGFLEIGDPQNHGFQYLHGLRTSIIWGLPHDFEHLHISYKITNIIMIMTNDNGLFGLINGYG